jgi:hypothetical protein
MRVPWRNVANLVGGYEFAISLNKVQRDGFKGDIGLRYTW